MIDPLRPVAPSERTVEPVGFRILTPLEREAERERRERERKKRQKPRPEPKRTSGGGLDIRA